MAEVFQLLIGGVIVGAVYGLIALGFVTIYRCSGVTNFAQGEFVMCGALLSVYLLQDKGLPYLAAVIISVGVTSVVGMLVYRLAVAPLRDSSIMPMIMATLGVSIFLQGTAQVTLGGYEKALPPFLSGREAFWLGPVSIAYQGLWVIVIAGIVLFMLHLANNWTLFGKKMTATATQPWAASLCGVSRRAMIQWSFAISGAVGAAGGILLATLLPMNYASGASFTLKGFAAAVLGGWGKSTGAVVGGLVLGILETVSVMVLPAGYRDAVAFAILLVILYCKPSGILGASLVEEGD